MKLTRSPCERNNYNPPLAPTIHLPGQENENIKDNISGSSTPSAWLPSLENILQGRIDSDGAYTFFADYLIECVVGKWKNNEKQ